MAEENLQATFNEVFEISVDIPKFLQSLGELKKAYLQFMADLGSAAGESILGPGLLQQMKEFQQEQSVITQEIQQDIKNVQSVFLEYLDKVDAKQEVNADKQRKRAKKTAEEELAAKREAASKFEQNLDIEQEGTVNKADLEQIKLFKKALAEIDAAREIELEQEGLINRSLEEQAKQKQRLAELDQKQIKLFEAELAQLDKIEAKEKQRQERATQKRQKDLENVFGKGDKFDRELDIEREGIVNQADITQIKLFKQALAEMDAAQRIAVEQEGEVARAMAEETKLRQKLNAEVEKSTTLLGREAAAGSNSRDAKINQLYKERADALNKAAEAKRRLDSAEFNKSEQPLREQLRLLREQNDARAKAISSLEQINRLTEQGTRAQERSNKENAGFVEKLTGGLQGSLVHLVRFYALWNGIDLILKSVGAAITAPFKAMIEGIGYLRETEEQADGLLAVLLSNAKFSADIAENFKLARSAAFDLTRILQEQAIDQNLKPEQIEATFKALLQGGVGRLEGDLKNVVTLASTFQQALEAAGVGGLAAQGSIEEIGKLLTGNVNAQNKFLAAIKATPQEWRNILQEAEKNRDLLGVLEQRIEPFRKALQTAQGSQAVLLKNFELMRKQLEGLAAEDAFREMNEALVSILAYLKQNGQEISRFFKFFVDGVSDSVEALIMLAKELKVFDYIKLVLVNLAGQFLIIKDTLVLMAETVNLLSKVNLGKLVSGQGGKEATEAVEHFKQKWQEMKEEMEDFDALASGRLMTGPRANKSKIGFENLAPPPPGESRLGNLRKDLAAEKQAFDQAANEVSRVYDRLRDQLQQKLADKQITYKENAEVLTRINADEVQKLHQLQEEFDRRAKVVRAKVAGDSAKPEQQEQATQDIDRVRREVQERVRQLAEKERRENERAKRDAIKEDVAIEKEGFEQRLRINKVGYDLERQAISDLVNAGVLTRAEAFEQETNTLKLEHADRLKILDAEVASYGVGTQEYVKAINKRAEEEFKYTESQGVLSKQRDELIRKETEQRIAHQQRLRAVLLESQALSLQISEDLLPPVGFSAAQDKLFQQKEKELEQLQRETIALAEVARAKNAESEETRKLTLDVQGLYNERLKLLRDRLSGAQGVDNPAIRKQFENNILNDANRTLQGREVELRGQLEGIVDGPEREAINKELEETRKQINEINRIFDEANPNLRSSFKRLLDIFVGFDVKKAWQGAETSMEKFSVGANAAAGVLANLGSIIDTFKQGSQKGGILGGIGAVGSQLSGALSSIPVIGQFIPAISGILSFVGGLFTASAKKIAADVKRSFEKTLDNYQNGNSTLIDTLNALERQRTDAILRLSGKKGGKDELDKLLPEFDREIQQLQQRQKQILGDFDATLQSLRQHSEVLVQVNKQWQDIVKQVKDYISAGGDATKAAEFLTLQLEKLKAQALAEFSSAEQEAVQNAIKLNDLLRQRNDLITDFKRQEFDLINADAIERRQAGSVTRGTELNRLRQQHQEQLANLDSQIKLTTVRVDKEREIFNLATDASALKRRDEELTLAALDSQIAKLKDLKALIGSFNGLQPGALASGVLVTVNFNGPVTSSDVANQVVSEVTAELNRQSRIVTR